MDAASQKMSPAQPDGLDETPIPPWELLFPKQVEIFNVQVDAEKKHPDAPVVLLVDGARESGKTIGCCHLACRHLWETPGARVALVVKITGSATDGGVWLDLVNDDNGIVPQWIEAGLEGKDPEITFEYTTRSKEGKPGPISDAKTRTIYFRVRNYFGGESEMRLISLQHEHEVKARLRSTRYSMIWFSELSNFTDPKVFQVSWEQLRMRHLRKHQHIWMADTNPDEEGEDSWIYRQFIRRLLDDTLFDKVKNSEQAKEQYLASIRRIPFTLEDNPTLTPVQIAIKRAHYANDIGESQRMCDGLWVRGHGTKGKHFADLFFPNIHVIGGSSAEIELDPTTITLYTGWDLGSSAYHSMGIIEKRIVLDPATKNEFSVWSVIDELFSEHEKIPIGDVGVRMLKKMEALEAAYAKKFQWKHWSDETALNVFRASSGTFDYWEIQNATEGKIILSGVPRPKYSVEARVRLLRKLLAERRFFVSGKCENVIAMLLNCREGIRKDDYVEWNQWKHTFDWVSYVLYMECGAELMSTARRPIVQDPAVSVPLA